jgi:glycosyltransferase involved in cell wall biosynthesis
MATGCAVLAPAYGPMKEVVNDGVDGVLFEPNDFSHAFRCLNDLVQNPELRARLGSAARATIERGYTWRDNARRVIAACESVLVKSVPQRAD